MKLSVYSNKITVKMQLSAIKSSIGQEYRLDLKHGKQAS